MLTCDPFIYCIFILVVPDRSGTLTVICFRKTVGEHEWSSLYPATMFLQGDSLYVLDGQQRINVVMTKNTGERGVYVRMLRKDTPIDVAVKIAQGIDIVRLGLL